MKIKQFVTAILGSLLIGVNAMASTALADTPLPEGAVKGLPERLAALDDEGNAVNSETGEYFFHVENMKYGETYTKNIQLMNLREDKSYHIYFYVEPLFKDGGNIDLTEQHFDCGYYAPGESHNLRCEIIWNEINVIKDVDNGHRLVDKDGEHVLVGPGESGYAEGEIEFKWIFYAQVEDPDTGSRTSGDTSKNEREGTPFTGMLSKPMFWVSCMTVLAGMIFFMLVLLKRKQEREKEQNQES